MIRDIICYVVMFFMLQYAISQLSKLVEVKPNVIVCQTNENGVNFNCRDINDKEYLLENKEALIEE